MQAGDNLFHKLPQYIKQIYFGICQIFKEDFLIKFLDMIQQI